MYQYLNIKRLFMLSVMLMSLNGYAQHDLKFHDISTLNDGPYVFIKEDKLIESSIINGAVINKDLPEGAFKIEYPVEQSNFENVENIVVLSDIHGQYDLAVELFKNNNIVNDDLSWNLGKGHLVIVGDVFDRGPKVNEMLWLIYKLEKQAKLSMGRVHLLLGNHEYMVLRNDLRYIHEKYNLVSKLLKTGYADLYSKQTVLGRWLRSKSTILKINQHTFVHGGISHAFLSGGYDRENTNKMMRESIDVKKEQLQSTGFYKKYYGTNGPIWYRGLILGNLGIQKINSILEQISSDHIVVGHCSDDKIIHLYDQKILGVDSSIKKGKYGELLFIENGTEYYRGTLEGKKIKITLD